MADWLVNRIGVEVSPWKLKKTTSILRGCCREDLCTCMSFRFVYGKAKENLQRCYKVPLIF